MSKYTTICAGQVWEAESGHRAVVYNLEFEGDADGRIALLQINACVLLFDEHCSILGRETLPCDKLREDYKLLYDATFIDPWKVD